MSGQKSPDAFRTISEVAEWLEVNAHVLRFWESKFSQIKPVKRAGGRRYYRKSDMELLGGIKQLLYVDGLTIKGAQKVLRERGVKAVCALSPPVDGIDEAPVEVSEATEVDAPETAQAAAADQDQDQRSEPELSSGKSGAAEASEESPVAPGDLSGLPQTLSPPQSDLEREPHDPAAPVADQALEQDDQVGAEEAANAGGMDQPGLFDAEPLVDSPSQRDDLVVAPLPPLPSESEADAPAASPVVFQRTPTPHASELDVDEAASTSPDIAPLPGHDLTLAEALGRLLPGEVSHSELAPMLERARDLRARMDLAG